MNVTWQSLVREARDLVLAGRLADAEEKKRQAEALKALDALSGAERPVARLPLVAASDDESNATGAAKAIESVYVRKYGDIDAGVKQIYRELYGTDNYPMLRAAKYADIARYLRTGVADPAYAKMILLTPEQIAAAVASGVPVSDGQYTIKSTMIEAQDTLGGVLVPEEVNQQMVERLPGLTVVRPRARVFTTSRDALQFLVRTGGDKRRIGAIRSKQTSEAPSSVTFSANATFGKLTVPVHVNLSRVFVSKSLLEDAAVDILNNVLMPEFVAEQAVREDEQFLVGSGVNEPQGVLNGVGAGNAPFNADITVVTGTGTGGAITFDDIVGAPWKIAGQYRMRRSPSVAWVFSSAVGAHIASLRENGTSGAYLWTEMYGNNATGNPDTLRGWAYAESEAMPEHTTNTHVIIFGDWQGYRIVDRIGMSIERYSDSALADADSVAFYCRRRYGGQVAEGYRFVVIRRGS